MDHLRTSLARKAVVLYLGNEFLNLPVNVLLLVSLQKVSYELC
jgi:hypothetical protein